jgi:uncharacterized protein YndB with AHSA1/START domain
MTELKIVKTVFLKAPPSHVWKFLTEKDRLLTWFFAAENDLKEGGPFKMISNTYGKEGEPVCWGEVLEARKPVRLVHTFTHNHLGGAETKCTWTLEPVGEGTVLTLIHEGWESFEADPFGMAANHDVGWDEFFQRLRHVTK